MWVGLHDSSGRSKYGPISSIYQLATVKYGHLGLVICCYYCLPENYTGSFGDQCLMKIVYFQGFRKIIRVGQKMILLYHLRVFFQKFFQTLPDHFFSLLTVEFATLSSFHSQHLRVYFHRLVHALENILTTSWTIFFKMSFVVSSSWFSGSTT